MARILVVDDDPDITKMAERILTSGGHMVVTAEDALRALDWLNQMPFDLMISDANMPRYSGFDLINTIRNNLKFKDMGIAMLTSLRERSDVARAVKVGVDDYIVKPLDPMLLMQKIEALLQKRPAQKYPEIRLGQPQGAATLRRPITIESISEMGLVVTSEEPLKVGQMLDIQAEIFQTLEIDPPALKVLSVELDAKTGQHRAQIIFLGAREAVLQKIRRWLYSHSASNKVA
jgi:DNA-binding response OmpR family regulator